MEVEKLVQDAEAEKHRKRKRRRTCLAVTAGVILAIVILILVLALTVFKAKRPVISIDSMSLQNFQFSLDVLRLAVNLNLTLHVDLSVKNPNKVGFRYSNSSALLNYRGQAVGEVPIPAGKISSDQTEGMNVSLTLMADRLLSNSQLYSDALSGVLPFNTYTKISGKVSVLGIKVKVHSTSSCDFSVFVSNRTVGDQKCLYKTKL